MNSINDKQRKFLDWLWESTLFKNNDRLHDYLKLGRYSNTDIPYLNQLRRMYQQSYNDAISVINQKEFVAKLFDGCKFKIGKSVTGTIYKLSVLKSDVRIRWGKTHEVGWPFEEVIEYSQDGTWMWESINKAV